MNRRIEYENSEQKYEVTPIELFFDLIYSFAFSQLTQYLLSDLSWEGIIRTLVMLIAMFMVWSYTSWAATMINADKSGTCLMILLVMFIGLFMNTSILGAFSNLGWVFISTFLIIQFGRTSWTITFSSDDTFREHFWRVLIWQVMSAPIWIAGACVSIRLRIFLWLIAAGVDLLGTWIGHPIPGRRFLSENIEFDTKHMLERCRLFRLIAIGEMVFTLGAAITNADLSYMTIVLGIVTMGEIVSLWALTFGRFYRIVAEHVEDTRNPVQASHYAINALVIILFGLVAISVANEHIILHPFEVPSPVLCFLLGGGPILFLSAQGWYLIKVPNIRPYRYIVCGILFLFVSFTACLFQSWIALIINGLILIMLSIFESTRS